MPICIVSENVQLLGQLYSSFSNKSGTIVHFQCVAFLIINAEEEASFWALTLFVDGMTKLNVRWIFNNSIQLCRSAYACVACLFRATSTTPQDNRMLPFENL